MARPLASLPRQLLRPRPIPRFQTLHASSSRPQQHQHQQQQQQVQGATDISHSQFLANAKAGSDFNPAQLPTAGSWTTADSYGRLDPTNSHLFKLILPLPTSLNGTSSGSAKKTDTIPTAFLLHPSQPLSHLSRLITGSLPSSERNVDITYLALTGQEADLESHLRSAETEGDGDAEGERGGERQDGGPRLAEREKSKGRWQEVSWSQSTDLSDFIKQSSSLNERFKIVIKPEEKEGLGPAGEGVTVEVVIPSFASRTTFLRGRLVKLSKELGALTKKKKEVDLAAHRSARRLGTTALAVGAVYWAAVVRFTFFTEAGWDMMEPVTWTTGFAALLCGTGFLIYHNREVSYSSLLDLSITARQRSLYDKHGLDIEKWTEMVAEAKTLRREIKRIAADYDLEWQGELENLASMDKFSPPPGAQMSTSSPTSTSRTKEAKEEQDDEDEREDDEDEKIDIDKTINEASEMAEETKERAEKLKDAERKGEVVDERSEKGKKKGKDGEDERAGAKRGREKAKRIMEKGSS